MPGEKDKTIGLTTAQVDAKHRAGESNYSSQETSRPVSEILKSNIFTLFNAILFTAFVVVLAMGDYRDAVFGIVFILNVIIGVFTELKSKRTLDSVAVLDTPTATVWRDGELIKIDTGDIVTDDAVELQLGDQVPADGIVYSSTGLEIDESALTGESKPVHKESGDKILSGTPVVAGSGIMIVNAIGGDAWAQKVTAEAKKYTRVKSEIQAAINQILRVITWMVPFILALLIWSQLRVEDDSWRPAVIFAIAGVVGMIPQGLVLLTSLNFGIAAATLARSGALVQELPAVEVLARVDRLCLDKTGTITTGRITGTKLLGSPQFSQEAVDALGWLTESKANDTSQAVYGLAEEAKNGKLTTLPKNYEVTPFSSSRKWAAIANAEKGTWVLGAPDIVLANATNSTWATDLVRTASSNGQRSVCLAWSPNVSSSPEHLPKNLDASIVALLQEEVRPDAAKTLRYFEDQKVSIRIISGDAPGTVEFVAQDVGLQTDETPLKVVDATKLPPTDSETFALAVTDVDVFGRVTPEQKKALVKVFQNEGHTVAMTGDGVNDAMALKEADLGIAMGNAAPATKAVSRIVLLNGEFALLPGVVAVGRRIIANMERVSSLFLAKTTYAILLAILVSLAGLAYPFLPRHLTYIGTFTIGVPSFFIALGPNSRRYKPGFLRRTLSIAVPAGIIVGLAALTSYLIVGKDSIPGQSAATLTLIIGALWLLANTALPLNIWRTILICLMACGAALGVLITPIRTFFALEWPTPHQWGTIFIVGVISCALIQLALWLTKPLRRDNKEKTRGT